MKTLLQVLLILFIPLQAFGEKTGEEFQVSTNCLYSGNGKDFRNMKCDIERLEVGGHYFSDRLIMNKASFIVSAGNITPSFSGEEYATFSGKGIPKEEVNYFWLNEQLQRTTSDESWLCFQRKHNQETFCEPTLEKMFNVTTPKKNIETLFSCTTEKNNLVTVLDKGSVFEYRVSKRASKADFSFENRAEDVKVQSKTEDGFTAKSIQMTNNGYEYTIVSMEILGSDIPAGVAAKDPQGKIVSEVYCKKFAEAMKRSSERKKNTPKKECSES